MRRRPTTSARGAAAHGATVAFIVDELREDILAGGLAPGSRLVECDLTARFSVSRGPVREALRRLAAEGLIDHVPHRGALVRRLAAQAIRELFQIRVEMEALAARLAAQSDDSGGARPLRPGDRPIFADGVRRLPDYLARTPPSTTRRWRSPAIRNCATWRRVSTCR